jgi:hypothetical protein
METTTAAVTVKITSISERFDNTTFADAAGSGMAILLCRQSYFHAQFGAVHESGSGTKLTYRSKRSLVRFWSEADMT